MELSDSLLNFSNIYILVGDTPPMVSDGTLKKEEKKVPKKRRKKEFM